MGELHSTVVSKFMGWVGKQETQQPVDSLQRAVSWGWTQHHVPEHELWPPSASSLHSGCSVWDGEGYSYVPLNWFSFHVNLATPQCKCFLKYNWHLHYRLGKYQITFNHASGLIQSLQDLERKNRVLLKEILPVSPTFWLRATTWTSTSALDLPPHDCVNHIRETNLSLCAWRGLFSLRNLDWHSSKP